MSHELPDDWYEDHDGQRLVLSSEKVAAGIAAARSDGLKEAHNWLRRQANSEKKPEARAAFIEAANAILAIAEGSSAPGQ